MTKPRKSAATLRLAGAFEHNPQRARSNPIAFGVIGPWRVGSSEPKEIWGELVSIAPEGVLTAADRPALQAATLLLARMRAHPADITPAQVTALFGALGKLAMTPHGRTQLSASPALAADAHDLHAAMLRHGAQN